MVLSWLSNSWIIADICLQTSQSVYVSESIGQKHWRMEWKGRACCFTMPRCSPASRAELLNQRATATQLLNLLHLTFPKRMLLLFALQSLALVCCIETVLLSVPRPKKNWGPLLQGGGPQTPKLQNVHWWCDITRFLGMWAVDSFHDSAAACRVRASELYRIRHVFLFDTNWWHLFRRWNTVNLG